MLYAPPLNEPLLNRPPCRRNATAMSATRLDSVLHYVRKVLGSQAEQGSDADLLQRFVRQRAETAVELLMWRHAAMVLRVCQSVLRDSHAAEDAFQPTFLA